jgi:hypothetical protein
MRNRSSTAAHRLLAVVVGLLALVLFSACYTDLLITIHIPSADATATIVRGDGRPEPLKIGVPASSSKLVYLSNCQGDGGFDAGTTTVTIASGYVVTGMTVKTGVGGVFTIAPGGPGITPVTGPPITMLAGDSFALDVEAITNGQLYLSAGTVFVFSSGLCYVITEDVL